MRILTADHRRVSISISEPEVLALFREGELEGMLHRAVLLEPTVAQMIATFASPQLRDFVLTVDRAAVIVLKQIPAAHQVDAEFLAEIILSEGKPIPRVTALQGSETPTTGAAAA